MKGCRALQIILGIISFFITIAMGAIAVLVLLPFVINVVGLAGILQTAVVGINNVLTRFGLVEYELITICVVFVLPTVLMVIASNCLLVGKRNGTRIAGTVLGTIAMTIFTLFTLVFSQDLFAEFQMMMFAIIGGTYVLYLFLVILAASLNKKYRKKQKQIENEYLQQSQEQSTEQTQETPANEQPAVEQAEQIHTALQVDEQPADQPSPVMFMAQDYSSVSDITDSTYHTTEVLSPKVMEKLKIARDLYEKGVISKEEYLSIVQKYLDDAK